MKRLRRATWPAGGPASDGSAAVDSAAVESAAEEDAEPARWTPMPWNVASNPRASDGDPIAGYRVLRRLGEGSRASVYLGRALECDAALKVFSPHSPVAEIDYEVAALDAIRSRHVVRLRDVATLGDGRTCLVLAPCIGGSLPTVLDGRGSIEAGEAVTVLAPVYEALGDAHRRGWSHGSLRMSSILFDEVAAPVLIGWGHGAVLSGREDDLATADLDRFLTLADGVLDRVSGLPDPGAASILRERLAGMVRSNAPPGSVVDLLFDFADPLPLAAMTGRAAEPPATDPATRATGSIRLRSTPAATPDATRSRPTRSGIVGPLRSAGNRIGTELARVRRPVWIVAALAVAAAVAIPLVPASTGGSGAGTESTGTESTGTESTGTESTGTESTGTVSGTGPPTAAVEGVPPPVAPGRSDGQGRVPTLDPSGLTAVLQSDDPVAAGAALLAARAACFEVRSVLCLDDVDSAGSAALEADRNAIRALQEGRVAGEILIDGRTPVLVERLGNSALLDLVPAPGSPETQPASLLLQKGEAGWRIRGVLVGDPLGATLPAAG